VTIESCIRLEVHPVSGLEKYNDYHDNFIIIISTIVIMINYYYHYFYYFYYFIIAVVIIFSVTIIIIIIIVLIITPYGGAWARVWWRLSRVAELGMSGQRRFARWVRQTPKFMDWRLVIY
jgi:hypothetical protein